MFLLTIFVLLAGVLHGQPTAYELDVEACTVFQTLFGKNSQMLTEVAKTHGASISESMKKGAFSMANKPPKDLRFFPSKFLFTLLNTGLESATDVQKMMEIITRAKKKLEYFDNLIQHPAERDTLCEDGQAMSDERLENKAGKMARNSQVMARSIVTVFHSVQGNLSNQQKMAIGESVGRILALEALQVCLFDDNLDRFRTTCEIAMQSKNVTPVAEEMAKKMPLGMGDDDDIRAELPLGKSAMVAAKNVTPEITGSLKSLAKKVGKIGTELPNKISVNGSAVTSKMVTDIPEKKLGNGTVNFSRLFEKKLDEGSADKEIPKIKFEKGTAKKTSEASLDLTKQGKVTKAKVTQKKLGKSDAKKKTKESSDNKKAKETQLKMDGSKKETVEKSLKRKKEEKENRLKMDGTKKDTKKENKLPKGDTKKKTEEKKAGKGDTKKETKKENKLPKGDTKKKTEEKKLGKGDTKKDIKKKIDEIKKEIKKENKLQKGDTKKETEEKKFGKGDTKKEIKKEKPLKMGDIKKEIKKENKLQKADIKKKAADVKKKLGKGDSKKMEAPEMNKEPQKKLEGRTLSMDPKKKMKKRHNKDKKGEF